MKGSNLIETRGDHHVDIRGNVEITSELLSPKSTMNNEDRKVTARPEALFRPRPHDNLVENLLYYLITPYVNK